MATDRFSRRESRLISRRLRMEPLEERRLLAVCDPDDDGETTPGDVAILAENFGIKEGATEREGDCNHDGSIDLLDAGLMQEHLGARRLDWGDAPDRSYPTRFASDGARHVLKENFHLGTAIDRDPDGQPSALANGDDTDFDGDDEDGVFFLTPAVPGVRQRVRVDASVDGLLDAFVDFNRDGDWDDVGEQVFTSEPLVTGMNFLSHLVPAGSLTDAERPTYARFRFSSAGGLTPRGTALDGEVEDYALFVLKADDVPAPIEVGTLWDWEMDLEQVSIPPPDDNRVTLEAAGPAEFRLGPAVNTENGMPFGLGGPDTLPPGSWHIDIELLEMQLTGTSSEPDAQMGGHRVHRAIVVTMRADQSSAGQGFLRSLDGGQTWSLDSSFDLAYQIEFEGGMTLVPRDGSSRVKKTRTFQNMSDQDIVSALRELSLDESDVGEPLVDANRPNEIWDYLRGLVTAIPRLDWGDAPDPAYPTLAASAGAAHVVRPGYSLGATVDAEPNGQRSPLASGDDLTGVPDDEDGVSFTSAIVPGGTAKVDVTATGGAGYLNAWIDFNRDGDWDDAGDQIFTSTLLSVGVNSLMFAVPATALASSTDPTPTRWRFSRQAVLGPRGLSSSGEVEDHAVFVLPASAVPPAIRHTFLWDAQADLAWSPCGPFGTIPTCEVAAEASGPAEMMLGPAVNTNTGEVVALGGPDTTQRLPDGSWRVPIELVMMTLTGATHDPVALLPTVDITITQVCLGGPYPMGDMDLDVLGGEVHSLSHNGHVYMKFGVSNFVYYNPTELSITKSVPWQGQPATFDTIAEHVTTLDYMEPPPVDFVTVAPPHALAFQLTKLHLEIPRNLDWGDAPNRPYPTLAASNGAAHVIRPGYMLGTAIDVEPDGQPSPLATGDDLTGIPDDEDGVAFKSAIVPGGTTKVDVTATGGAGFLNAWIDFNRDGDWDDAGEQVFTSELLSPGVNSLSFAVPTAAVPDLGVPTPTRWRFSRQAVLGPRGLASSGEVEDMAVFITPAAAVPPPTVVPMPWEWNLEWEELSGPGEGPSAIVMAEAAGSAEFRIGPVVDTDNGHVGPWFDEDLSIVNCGRCFVPIELGQMHLAGVASKNEVAIETLEIVHEGFQMGDSSGNVIYVATAGGGVWKVEDGFLDIAYRIDFGNGMSLMPEGGSMRLVAEVGTVPAVNAFLYFKDSPIVGGAIPLVEVDPPHAAWDILRRVTTGPPRRDYGDLPDRPYATLQASNGARHTIRPGFHLGAAIDADLNGQPDPAARRDDENGIPDDEDGVFFLTAPTPGAPQRVRVDASAPGMLEAFVDFTRDGDFDDASEQIFASQPLVAGMNFLPYFVPTGTPTSETAPTYARFRLSSAGGLAPAGPAADGEVEDYALFIHDPQSLPAPLEVAVPAWDWELKADTAAMPGAPSLLVDAEAVGPATFLFSPPVNTDNGMTFELGGPDTLPPGSWHVETELLEMDLAGTWSTSGDADDRPTEEVAFYYNKIAFQNSSLGGMMLTARPSGSWHVDSFFDIAYRIDFANGMSLVPAGGSMRLENSETHTEPAGRLEHPNLVFYLPLSPSAGGQPLVNAQSPQEIWDYVRGLRTQVPPLDWGDAPDRPYPTLAASAGAAHVIRPGYSLGPTVDAELDGQPSPLATRDDTSGVPDDEDGVAFTSLLIPGGMATVDVTATGGVGFLNAWIDYNRDGDWNDAGEQIFASELLAMGVNSLSFAVPATARPDSAAPTPSRWRFSRQNVLGVGGLSSSGEVEDHAVYVYAAQPAPVVATLPWEWGLAFTALDGEGNRQGEPRMVNLAGEVEIQYAAPIVQSTAQTFDLLAPETMPEGEPVLINMSIFKGELVGVEPSFTLPEVEDEVLVAFEHGDIRRPVVIGSLWSKRSGSTILPRVGWEMSVDFSADHPDFAWLPTNNPTPAEFSMTFVPPDGLPLADLLTAPLYASLEGKSTFWIRVAQGHTTAWTWESVHARPARLDWGDAPDPSYPTLAASAGARHIIRPGYSLGPAVDPDANGQPHPIALGDDSDADGDDEDGVVIASPIFPGGATTVIVTAVGGRGYLNAWTDFNRNGSWEPAEQIFTDVLLSVGANTLTFSVPTATAPDSGDIRPVISRWQFSRQTGLTTTGLSSSGEVEDHLLRITPRPAGAPEAPAAVVAAVDRAMTPIARPSSVRLVVADKRIVRPTGDGVAILARSERRIYAARQSRRIEAVDHVLTAPID